MIKPNQFKLMITENKTPIVLLSMVSIAWFLTFFSGLKSAASVWWISEIFHHCAFVVPISFWLIYQQRHELLATEPKPNFMALPLLILLLFLQVFGFAGDIQVFQYIATFVSIPVIFWLCLGTQVCKKILFPLFFIVFAIPVGDELIPILQEVTADLSVFYLQLINVPVYRNGLFLDIPNGKFYVAEACSGISFLIVSVVFGNLYAYLSFKHYKKKILFLFLSFSVPILANSLRAFGIALVGHYFGMEYAVGTDHLIYGWVFYCFVLFLLILIGERLRDKFEPNAPVKTTVNLVWNTIFNRMSMFIILTMLVSIFIWQLIFQNLSVPDKKNPRIIKISNLISTTNYSNWQPQFFGSEADFRGKIKLKEGYLADIYFASYNRSSKGELISSKNHLYNKKYWHPEHSGEILTSREGLIVKFIKLKNFKGRYRLILYVYIVGNKTFHQPINAKLFQTLRWLKGDNFNDGFVAISTIINDDLTQKEDLLKWFESEQFRYIADAK